MAFFQERKGTYYSEERAKATFDFKICFGKTLIASDLDKKTYIKRCTSNYVISRVKRRDGENPDFDFVPLLFTLLT